MPASVVPVPPGATVNVRWVGIEGGQSAAMPNEVGIVTIPPVALIAVLITRSEPVAGFWSQVSVLVAMSVAVAPAAIVTGEE